MLLQIRGKMSALMLAEELEVSERTVYRDMDALAMAGVPVYAERGPGGGISLLEDYTTRLNGLSTAEARALFMLSIPGPLQQLGIGAEMKAALLKLSAALPETLRSEQEAARQRIHLDANAWGQAGEAPPQLAVLQRALWQDRRVEILIHTVFGVQIELVVDPLGLVSKASDWHLVARRETGLRVFRIADLLHARQLDEPFTRPVEFSLSAFWEAYCSQVEAERGLYWVQMRISAGLAHELPLRLGERAVGVLENAGPADEVGWRMVRMPFDSLEQARDKIFSFGGAAQVLGPQALVYSLIDYAEQIRKVYLA
jgi:predicted DNA-binding transcriptional regulator YafY